MKTSRSEARCHTRAIPELRFEDQALTSCAGLVIFQDLFATLELKTRLRACFRHVRIGAIYNRSTVFLQLVVHILLGYRQLQDSRYYSDDPLVQRLLGLKRLPSVSTLSRMLKDATEASVKKVRHLLREMCLERLRSLALSRVTLEFDGSVQSTGRYAEGTAVGFNKKKKGARSYYPLFCMIAQTGQVLDVLHRPGNVHDSKEAEAFILACIEAVRAVVPHAVIEVRMDSAFFSDAIVSALDSAGVEFTISVPFERFTELKGMIEGRRRWRRVHRNVSYFETAWKPKSWNQRFRFLFVRTRTKKQHKGPVQLDLFVPHEYGYDFKVIVTNKTLKAKALVAFHEGRGSQEKVFAELKTSCGVDYVPVRTRVGNHLYLLAGLLAHNLTRELQMTTTPPCRKTTEKRSALWVFETLETIRNTLIRRAGRLTRPNNRLTLTLNINPSVRSRLLQFLGLATPAA